MTVKRVNKSKEQLKSELVHVESVKQQKKVAHTVFPLVAKLDSVYDAQTAFSACAGLIQQRLTAKEKDLKVSDLDIDMAVKKEGKVEKAAQAILKAVEGEDARTMAILLESMSSQLAKFLANKALKGKMSQITAKEFIAD